MPYYSGRHRGRWSGADWAGYHVRKREGVTRLFGGIDKDIEHIFLHLSGNRLAALFSDYGKAHGKGAESYARRTYPKWKSGEVMLSGDTATRLLGLVPPRLDAKVRFELVRKLRSHYIQRTTHKVECAVANWESAVAPLVDNLIAKGFSVNLPAQVTAGALWLAADDVTLARQLLAEAEAQEAAIRTAFLAKEFEDIGRAASQLTHVRASFEHTIMLPHGDIQITIRTSIPAKRSLGDLFRRGRRAMPHHDDSDNPLVKSSPTVPGRRENLLDRPLNNLTPEEQKQLQAKIVDTRLQLDVSARQAEDRLLNSSRDMARDLRMTQELDRGQNDYSLDGSYEGASGRTNLRVRKATNITVVVVAVVIALVIILVVFNR